MAAKQKKVSLLLDPALWERVRDYRFAKRFDSVNEAICTLIEKGLQLDNQKDDGDA